LLAAALRPVLPRRGWPAALRDAISAGFTGDTVLAVHDRRHLSPFGTLWPRSPYTRLRVTRPRSLEPRETGGPIDEQFRSCWEEPLDAGPHKFAKGGTVNEGTARHNDRFFALRNVRVLEAAFGVSDRNDACRAHRRRRRTRSRPFVQRPSPPRCWTPRLRRG